VATDGEDRWGRSAVVEVLPVIGCASLDRIKDFGGEFGSGEPRPQSHRPHLYLLRSVTGAFQL